eukprot:scaffold116751_cov35-Tisochrysis_lutea.AAC.3
MIKRLEGYIMLGLIASFSATVALVVYTSRLRDGETEPMRHHHFPPQLSAESKRALAAQAEAQALSAILPTACASPDTNGACKTWAAAGECDKNSKYMHEACAHACRLCSTAPAPQAPPLTIEKDCADLSPFCGQWAAVGECDSNPNYMRSNCRVRRSSAPNLTSFIFASVYSFHRAHGLVSPATCANPPHATTSIPFAVRQTHRLVAASGIHRVCSASAAGRADGESPAPTFFKE